MAKINDPDLLTYSVNGATGNLRFDTTNKTIELVEAGSFTFKDGVTGQCLFSKFKLILKSDPNLNKYALAMREMIHDESLELINGWTFKNTNTLKAIRDCGVAYKNAAGVITAEFACIVTLGTLLTGAPYLVQTNTTDATIVDFTHINIGQSFGVNELVQIYSDTNGDGTPDYDRRSYLKVFLREYAHTYDEATNTDIGYPALTFKKYNYPITHVPDTGVTKDDTTVDAYTGMSITWGAVSGIYLGANGPYSFGMQAQTNGKTYDEIYSWVQRQLRKSTDIDAAAGTARIGKVTPALVKMLDGKLNTIYQPGVGGFHLASPSATSYNFILEADNSQIMRGYPYTAAVEFQFDSFLQADGANTIFWIFDAATYPGDSATLLLDASSNPMTGDLTGNVATKSFSYAWSANKSWIGVATGLDGAKVAIASGVIEQSVGNKGVFVSGEERWYKNP